MVLINLLPWRAQAQLYQQKQRRWMLAGAVMSGAAVVMILHVGLQLWVGRLTQHLVELNAAINQLQQRHQGVVGTGATQYVQEHNQMAGYQAGTRQLIRYLNEAHASGVCFNKISRYQRGVRFHGYADSAQVLSRFLTDWPAGASFSEIRIESIKPDHADQLAFILEGIEKQRLDLPLVRRDQQPHA